MRGKLEETTINESSSNFNQQTIQSNPYESTNVNQQTIQSNPYESTNVNQQQVTQERASEEPPPPPYITVNQPTLNSKPRSENVVQNSSINNQNVQATPAPQIRIFERHPTNILCPTCGITVLTRVETNSTIVTILLAILLCFFCLCLGLIPFCMPSCKKTTHYCPNCHRILGKVAEFQ